MNLLMEESQQKDELSDPKPPVVAVSAAYVGQRLGITARHAHDLMLKDEFGVAFRVGDSLRIDLPDLEAYIESRKKLGPTFRTSIRGGGNGPKRRRKKTEQEK